MDLLLWQNTFIVWFKFTNLILFPTLFTIYLDKTFSLVIKFNSLWIWGKKKLIKSMASPAIPWKVGFKE